MSTETNKALARRWIEGVWNKGELSLIEELIAPNYVLHDPTRPGLKGRESIRESITGFRAAFPDLHFTLEDQLAEGDQVVICYTVRVLAHLRYTCKRREAKETRLCCSRCGKATMKETTNHEDQHVIEKVTAHILCPGVRSFSALLAAC